jgi:hypothetical protein
MPFYRLSEGFLSAKRCVLTRAGTDKRRLSTEEEFEQELREQTEEN